MTQPPAVLPQVVCLSPDQAPCFTQEPPDAPTLRQQLNDRVFDPPKKRQLFSSLIALVAFLHAHGIVHRGLSPDVIYYVASEERLYITGFAQAIRLGDDHAARLAPSPYTAPEQCSLGADSVLFEPRADLFSLGAILYELLAERPPFSGSGPALLLALLQGAPTPPRDLGVDCAPALEALCLQLLSREKQERPASAQEVLAALRALSAAPEPAVAPLAPAIEAPVAAQAPQAPGATARYEVQGELSREGPGRVLLAYDKLLERPVALTEGPRGDAEARFLREALLTAKLEHPGVTPVYDLGRWEAGEPFYTKKLTEGRPLETLITARQLFEDRLALLPHLIAACEVIAFAHARQIIHRDLSPQRILVGSFGEVVVLGWGNAVDRQSAEAPAEQGLTNAGAVLEAPTYMPPEQANGDPADPRADVYSLGAILYQLLCGAPPYTSKKSLEVLAALIDGPPPLLQERQPETPKVLAEIVHKAMSRQAQDRYPSALELLEALRRFARGQLVGVHQYTSRELLRRWFKKNRLLVSAGLTLAATILSGVIIDDMRLRDQQAEFEKKRREGYEQRELLQMQNDRLDVENEKQKKSLEELKLSQALSWLDVDPLMSLSWLHDLDREHPNQPWSFARLVALAAELRGIPAAVLGASWSTPSCVSQGASHHLLFSLDGAFLISGEDDGSLRVWTVKTSECRTLLAHRAAISQLALSPDGSRLVSASRDGFVFLWRTRDWARTRLEEAPGEVRALAFSPDGHRLAWGGAFPEVVLWDVAREEALARFKVFDALTSSAHAVSQLAFEPEGVRLASVRDDGVVQLWGADATKSLYQNSSNQGPAQGAGVFFSADGLQLISFTRGLSTILVTELSAKRSQRLEKPTNTAEVALSPDGRWLAAADVEGALWLWDLLEAPKKRRPLVLRSKPSKVSALAFSGDGQWLISGGEDGVVRVYSLLGELAWVLRGHEAGVARLACTTQGMLASASGDHTIRLWALGALRRLSTPQGEVRDISFSLAGGELVTAGVGASATVWQTAPPLYAPLREFSIPKPQTILGASFSPGGYWVATAREDGSLYLRSVDGKESRLLHTFQKPPTAVHFTANGALLWVSSAEGTLTAWEIPSGQLVSTLAAPAPTEEPLVDFALLPGDTQAITASSTGRLRLWDLKAQAPQEAPPQQADFDLRQVALSPSGAYAVAAGGSSALFFWELARGQARQLSTPQGAVTGVVFASDEVFLTASADGSLRAWDVASFESVALSVGGALSALAFDAQSRKLSYATVLGLASSLWLRELPLREFSEVELWWQSRKLPPKQALLRP